MKPMLLAVALTAQLLVAQDLASSPQGPAADSPAVLTTTVTSGLSLPSVRLDRSETDDSLWGLGETWKARFDGRGFAFIPFFGSSAPTTYPLRLELAAATVGGVALELPVGRPEAVGDVVETKRGALTERIATGLRSVEQSFVFASLPQRAAIAVEVRMQGAYEVAPIDGGLRFSHELGGVDYTKAVAVDAAGQRLPLEIRWLGDRARMEIPAAFVERATLPIVLDPLLNGWVFLASGITQYQHDADVATFQALGGRTCKVWIRQFAADDGDCFASVFDGNLGIVAPNITLDYTGADWRNAAVASNNYAQNFLVVAEVRNVFEHSIVGRLVSGTGVVGPTFDIERTGVVGTAGYNFTPDVGGDPSFAAGGRYTVVFIKEYAFVRYAMMKQVSASGGLVTTNASNLDGFTAFIETSSPSISKSCGSPNGLQQWLLTWEARDPTMAVQSTAARARYVSWNGVVGPLFNVVGAFGLEQQTKPSACSPIDVGGQRLWPVAYEWASAPGQTRDVVCRVLRADRTVSSTFLANLTIPGLDDFAPEIDSDGTRLTIVYSKGTDIDLVTFAVLPDATVREEMRSGILQPVANNCGQVNICADRSGGGLVTNRYVAVYTDLTTNTFTLQAWAGHRGGGYSSRPYGCGNCQIAAFGAPAIGQQVHFLVDNGSPSSVLLFSEPDTIYLSLFFGCNCILGVRSDFILAPSSTYWTIPNEVQFVGAQLSVQGANLVGSQCDGYIDLSDTRDFSLL